MGWWSWQIACHYAPIIKINHLPAKSREFFYSRYCFKY